MNILWIRHFPVADAGRYTGQTDVDAVLPAGPVAFDAPPGAAWFASPLKRAVQTAEFLGARNLQTAPGLMEQHFGAWEGKRYGEVQHDWRDPASIRPPGGESFEDVCARVDRWLERVLSLEEVYVVAHAGVIRAGLAHALGFSPAQALAFQVECGAAASVSYLPGGVRVNYVNRPLLRHK